MFCDLHRCYTFHVPKFRGTQHKIFFFSSAGDPLACWTFESFYFLLLVIFGSDFVT
jgi:hypothetical protein